MRKGFKVSVTSLSLGSPTQANGLIQQSAAEVSGEDADWEGFGMSWSFKTWDYNGISQGSCV